MLLVGRASASSHRSYPRQSYARRDGCVVGVRSNHGMDGSPCLPVFYQRLDRHPRVLPRRSLASVHPSLLPRHACLIDGPRSRPQRLARRTFASCPSVRTGWSISPPSTVVSSSMQVDRALRGVLVYPLGWVRLRHPLLGSRWLGWMEKGKADPVHRGWGSGEPPWHPKGSPQTPPRPTASAAVARASVRARWRGSPSQWHWPAWPPPHTPKSTTKRRSTVRDDAILRSNPPAQAKKDERTGTNPTRMEPSRRAVVGNTTANQTKEDGTDRSTDVLRTRERHVTMQTNGRKDGRNPAGNKTKARLEIGSTRPENGTGMQKTKGSKPRPIRGSSPSRRN